MCTKVWPSTYATENAQVGGNSGQKSGKTCVLFQDVLGDGESRPLIHSMVIYVNMSLISISLPSNSISIVVFASIVILFDITAGISFLGKIFKII